MTVLTSIFAKLWVELQISASQFIYRRFLEL